MRPHERENNLYKSGKRCEISNAEYILFDYLEKYINPGSRILDIGCGSGDITKIIEQKGYNIIGLDFSSIAIEIAKSLGVNCQLVDIDAGRTCLRSYICFKRSKSSISK